MKKRGSVLIIDDQINLLETLKLTLDDSVEKIYLSQSGKDGLKVIENNKIDCIICDVFMPEMNGVEVIKTIRHNNLNIPFIFYTGFGSKELMFEAAQYGAFDFLEKPSLDKLVDVVGQAIRYSESKKI